MAHASPIEIEYDDKEIRETVRKLYAYMPETLRVGLLEAMEEVGLKSVSGYMKHREALKNKKGKYTGKVAARLSRSEPIGIVSGKLKDSILGKGTNKIRKIVKDADGYHGIMGSKLIYAMVHEKGSPSRHIPARPYLEPAAKDSEGKVRQILKAKLDDAIRKAS